MEKIFARKLMTKYSWTGNSKNQPKKSFAALKNIRLFLFYVISGAATYMTEPDLEAFIKNCILKHAETRAGNDGSLSASVPRTSTNRAKKTQSQETPNVNIWMIIFFYFKITILKVKTVCEYKYVILTFIIY